MQRYSSSQIQQPEEKKLLTASFFCLALYCQNFCQTGDLADKKPTPKIVVASWYGLSGQTMANGQIFDRRNKQLAAHKHLPLGSKVELTNPQNDKKLVVKITDRGPYIKGRDFDLSQAAADYLGFTEDGVAKLLAQVVYQPSADPG